MPVLSDSQITEYCSNGMIEPFNPAYVNPASLDLRLHPALIEITAGGVLDASNNGAAASKLTTERTIFLQHGQKYLLQPGVFILASSMEYIKLPSELAAEVKLKSTTARRGIGHVYSGWIDPGFEGNITFELFSHVPVILEAGQLIVQIVFMEMSQVPEKPYQGRYQGQQGPTAAKIEQPTLPFMDVNETPGVHAVRASWLPRNVDDLANQVKADFSDWGDYQE